MRIQSFRAGLTGLSCSRHSSCGSCCAILALPTDAFHVSYFCFAVEFRRREAARKLQQL